LKISMSGRILYGFGGFGRFGGGMILQSGPALAVKYAWIFGDLSVSKSLPFQASWSFL